MTLKTLYVCDNKSNIELFINHIEKTNTKITICPITTDHTAIERYTDSIKNHTGENPKIIDFAEIFHKKAFDIREDFIKLISDFSDKQLFNGKNIKTFLTYPKEKLSLWWLSLISEKNTVKRDSFNNLVKFLTIIDTIKNNSYDEIIIDVSYEKLFAALKKFFEKKKEDVEFLHHPKKNQKINLQKKLINFLNVFNLFINVFLVKINM